MCSNHKAVVQLLACLSTQYWIKAVLGPGKWLELQRLHKRCANKWQEGTRRIMAVYGTWLDHCTSARVHCIIADVTTCAHDIAPSTIVWGNQLAYAYAQYSTHIR